MNHPPRVRPRPPPCSELLIAGAARAPASARRSIPTKQPSRERHDDTALAHRPRGAPPSLTSSPSLLPHCAHCLQLLGAVSTPEDRPKPTDRTYCTYVQTPGPDDTTQPSFPDHARTRRRCVQKCRSHATAHPSAARTSLSETSSSPPPSVRLQVAYAGKAPCRRSPPLPPP